MKIVEQILLLWIVELYDYFLKKKVKIFKLEKKSKIRVINMKFLKNKKTYRSSLVSDTNLFHLSLQIKASIDT